MEKQKQHALVIGAGIGGMASAALLAKDGYRVTVLERNDSTGGRARTWKAQGFTFDMGPSWYLMPEVFERFFALFGEKVEDWYQLRRLEPSYRLLQEEGQQFDVCSEAAQIEALFESIEPGAGIKLRRYLEDAGFKYDIAMREFLYREYRSVFDFLNKRMLLDGLRLKVLGNLDREVRRHFKNPRTRQILEYAMVFLGTEPAAAPGLYSIMSHVDLKQGVFYPMGGLAAVADAVKGLASKLGVEFLLSTEVEEIVVENGLATGVRHRPSGSGGSESQFLAADLILANADYAHVETRLLPRKYQSYPSAYWRRKVVAPSLFVMYLGLDKTLDKLTHHNLYFQEDWRTHFASIFRKPAWPDDPCFYVSCISKTDPAMAPAGCENVFLLVPVAPGLDDSDVVREEYARRAIAHLEAISGENIRDHVLVQRIFSHRDYSGDYNALQGTALGISHTLGQTAVFRPSTRSRKVRNLLYAGQYTHPGIGVPMVLISAELAAAAARDLEGTRHGA